MKTYEHVYDILSKSPDFVTGESLAKSLGVSRTAIWKAIQTLQEQGIDITSVRKKGYYLEKGDILLPQDISKPVSYTHLDVYKRQGKTHFARSNSSSRSRV